MITTISAPPESPLGEMPNRGKVHLAKAYSMKAIHLAKPGKAIYSPTEGSYVEPHVSHPDEIKEVSEAPLRLPRLSRAGVGYVGDINNKEEVVW